MSRSFGDWSEFTPEAIKTYSEEDLVYAKTLARGSIYGQWANAELERRHILALQAATERVHQEVGRLASSSMTLEKLTKTLKNLTWALIFLTIIAGAVPVAIEVWKTRHEVDIPAPPPTPPQP